jgi:hypothetical protein
MAKRTEDEVYDTLDEKAILWAIHKNLIDTQQSVKTIALIAQIYFGLTLLGFLLVFLTANR